MNLIKNLHQNITNKQKTKLDAPNGPLAAILRLLTILRNNYLQNRVPKRKGSALLILEQLTIVVADLVNFPYPLEELAKFDRMNFQKQCKNARSQVMRRQADRVYGIYQQKKYEQYPYNQSTILQLERLDNQQVDDCSKCRQALFSIYRQSQEQEQRQFLEILLCYQDGLIKEQYLLQPWRQLWTWLYIWTNRVLENMITQQQNLSMGKRIEQAIDRHLINADPVKRQVEQVIICLVNSVIGLLLPNSTFKEQLIDAYKTFKGVYPKLLESFNEKQTNIYACIQGILLFHSSFELNTISIESGEKDLDALRKNIKKVFGEKQIYLQTQLESYLLTPQQLPEFLKNNHLPFWEYELSQKVKQQIARSAIRNLNPDFGRNHKYWETTLHLLHPNDIRNIFSSPELWNLSNGQTNKWVDTFFDLCRSSEVTDFVKGVGEAIGAQNYEQVQKDLNLFEKQWKNYIQLEKSQRNNRKRVDYEELLTFSFHVGQKFEKICVFPQQLPNIFKQLCEQHLNLLAYELSKQKQFNSSLLEFAYTPAFVNNLMKFSSSQWDQQWDEYWSKWANLSLANRQLMLDLLEIQPEGQAEQLEQEKLQ